MSEACEKMLGNLVRAGEDWLLLRFVGDHGLAMGVRIDTRHGIVGTEVYEADPNDATFKALEARPPKYGPLVDNDLFGSVLYKQDGPALFILGRLLNGAHAGVVIKDDEPVNGRLVPVDPANPSYVALKKALARFNVLHPVRRTP